LLPLRISLCDPECEILIPAAPLGGGWFWGAFLSLVRVVGGSTATGKTGTISENVNMLGFWDMDDACGV
jgi:hypothetical protein